MINAAEWTAKVNAFEVHPETLRLQAEILPLCAKVKALGELIDSNFNRGRNGEVIPSEVVNRTWADYHSAAIEADKAYNRFAAWSRENGIASVDRDSARHIKGLAWFNSQLLEAA